MLNQELTQYATWRLWPVHAVARIFGVLVHVNGVPFGSNRTVMFHRAASCELTGGPNPLVSGSSCSPIRPKRTEACCDR